MPFQKGKKISAKKVKKKKKALPKAKKKTLQKKESLIRPAAIKSALDAAVREGNFTVAKGCKSALQRQTLRKSLRKS